MDKNSGIKIVANNKKAYHDYFVLEKLEAGIELFGTEVKSIRQGKINLKDSWCFVKDGETEKAKAKAKEFGADVVMNPAKEDVVAKIKEMTGGYGCDIYIEASGHPSSVQQGLDCIRKMGRFVEFSVFGAPVTVDWSIISDRKELDLLGVHLSPFCYDTVIEWIGNGKLPTEGVVTHKYPLEQWEEAFHVAKTAQDGALKVILVPEM